MAGGAGVGEDVEAVMIGLGGVGWRVGGGEGREVLLFDSVVVGLEEVGEVVAEMAFGAGCGVDVDEIAVEGEEGTVVDVCFRELHLLVRDGNEMLRGFPVGMRTCSKT